MQMANGFSLLWNEIYFDKQDTSAKWFQLQYKNVYSSR